MNHNTTNIKNIKKYPALTPTTIDSYYKARVQHDMPELALESGTPIPMFKIQSMVERVEIQPH